MTPSADLPVAPSDLRVCHLCASNVNGHYFQDIARHFTERGVSLSLGTLGTPAPPAWLALGETPRVDYFSLAATSRRLYPAAVIRLAARLRAVRPHVLHTHLFDAAFVGLAAGRLAGVPLTVVGRHHLDQHQQLRRPLHVKLDQLAARSAARVIVPAEALRRHMVDVEHVPADHITVIHLGVDTEAALTQSGAPGPLRDEFGLAGCFVVGIVARLEPGKGFDTLLTAAHSLRPRLPELRVVIVGDHPDPQNRRRLEQQSLELGLSDIVVFAGWRHDAVACMRSMDVLALPSRTEALPQVLIEAIATGTPVVASDVGGIPEIIDSGRNGDLIPPSDPEALASALWALYAEPERRATYSAAGIITAREKFDARLMADRHVDCYLQALAEVRAER